MTTVRIATQTSLTLRRTSAATGGLVFVALRRTAQVHHMVVIQWQMVIQAVLGHLLAGPVCEARAERRGRRALRPPAAVLGGARWV